MAAKKVCCVPGCSAPAAALGACTTHLGLNGGPRLVPVPDGRTFDGDTNRLLKMHELEAEFAAMVAASPGKEFWVPDGLMLFRRPTTPKKHLDRVIQRINRSAAWSELPGTYRAWSSGSRAFVSWQPDEEEEEVVVAGAVSKRYA